MDQTESEWNGWEIGDPGDQNSLTDPFQKPEDVASVLSGEGGKSDTMYDSSNVEGDDSNFQFEGGFDSFEDMSESQSDDEGDGSQSDTSNIVEQSPYRFMNGNDGMATCERCGSVGIKHAFYSKSKRFCSLACSRSTGDMDYSPSGPKKQIIKKQKSGKSLNRQRNKSQSQKSGGTRSFDWGSYILGSHTEGAPVSCFTHVPMSDSWDNITVGMKVETLNHDCDLPNEVYWISTVMKLTGYRALMRYEGFGSDGHKDYWVNLCGKDVHPVGWCATTGKPLVPPKTIQHKYSDWKDYLVKRLTGSRTLPSNFYNKVQEGINDHKFRKGVHVEVVNRMCVSAMRVATVEDVTGGRLRLKYDDAKEEGDEFWCHRKSALIHPVGWAQQVGHKLHSTPEYRNQCLGKITMQKYEPNDATPEMFPKVKKNAFLDGYKFQVGQKLEAIDPLNLSAICVASVAKVLKNNYLMISIDGTLAQNGSDWFCYHASSPCIFPVGFCEVNGLILTPPRGSKLPFKWFDYLKQTRSTAASVKLFDKEIPKHGFKSGMKLEAVDLMEPRLICVATIAKVVGRLLRIHFDGWESEYDQWVDCESPDLYPIGWCELMEYPIEGPRLKTEVPFTIPNPQSSTKKRKGKTQIYKGPRKSQLTKRKPKTPLSPIPTIKSMSSQFEIMRHRLLNTRPEEVTERPQEVPQSSELLMDVKPLVEVKQEPMEIEDNVPSVEQQQQQLLMSSSISADIKPDVRKLDSQLINPLVKPSTTNTVIYPFTTTARITSTASPAHSISGNLLAGHLTGTLPLNVSNSGLVSTTLASGQTQSTAVKPQPKMTYSGGQTQQTQQTETQTLYLTQRQQTLPLQEWSIIDVCHFLKYNDCSSYVEVFHRQNITGEQFMNLSKEQLAKLTGMKVGPSLKIYDLIQVLKSKIIHQKPLTTTAK